MLSLPLHNEASFKLTHGLAHRRRKNASLRSIGEEPVPGWDAGVKRMARWLRRYPMPAIAIKNQEVRYMHASAFWRLLDEGLIE
jgi:hypothetical protein